MAESARTTDAFDEVITYLGLPTSHNILYRVTRDRNLQVDAIRRLAAAIESNDIEISSITQLEGGELRIGIRKVKHSNAEQRLDRLGT